MKKIIVVILTIATIPGVYSCKKKFDPIGTSLNKDNLAYVQIFSATVTAARNYAYIDGVPVTGVAFAYGGLYPSTAFSFTVPNGTHAVLIKDTLATTKQAQLAFSEAFEAGKKYTIFTYDTITAAKKLTVENNIQIPADTTARLRMANFLYSAGAVPAVDVFSFKKNANVFTNVANKTVTDFIPFESSAVADTLYVREAGTSIQLGKVAVSFTKQRSYTAIVRGSYLGTKAVSTFINY